MMNLLTLIQKKMKKRTIILSSLRTADKFDVSISPWSLCRSGEEEEKKDGNDDDDDEEEDDYQDDEEDASADGYGYDDDGSVVDDENSDESDDDEEPVGEDNNDEEEYLNSLTNKVLQDKLRERGLKVSGKKSILIDRLMGREETAEIISKPIVGRH